MHKKITSCFYIFSTLLLLLFTELPDHPVLAFPAASYPLFGQIFTFIKWVFSTLGIRYRNPSRFGVLCYIREKKGEKFLRKLSLHILNFHVGTLFIEKKQNALVQWMQFSWHIYWEVIFNEVHIISLLSLQIHAHNPGSNLPVNLQTSSSFSLGGCVSSTLEAVCTYVQNGCPGSYGWP